MKDIKEIIKENISNISGNYKEFWYEVSPHVNKMKGDESRRDRVIVSKKSFEKRIKDALRTISKKHEPTPGQEYFVTYLTDDKRCGFPILLDSVPPQHIRQRLSPKSSQYEYVALVKTPAPCADKSTKRPYSSPNDIKIKLSESVESCIGHDTIPQDIHDYILKTFEFEVNEDKNAVFYTSNMNTFLDRKYTAISENNEIIEQRKDNGLHIVDLDKEKIY